jgi:membrane-bound inhibitor of C-type lysozyme
MKHEIARAVALVCASLILNGCSSISVWPFGGTPEQNPTRAPADATAYKCDGGKHLFVRYLDKGAAAWVILPDRQFRLNKVGADSGSRYGNGSDTLELRDKAATLSDSAGVNYANCKASGG